jgi:hypothetical protein
MLKPYVQQKHSYAAYVEPEEEFCADTDMAVLEFVCKTSVSEVCI